MSCTAPTRELITFWVAGSLGPDEAAQVSNHVDSCAECRAAAIEGLTLVKGIRELHLTAEEIVAAAAGDVNAPHVLVCSRCRDEVTMLRAVNADLTLASGSSARWRRPAGLAMLAAAAVILAFWVVPRRAPDTQITRSANPPAAVELLPTTQDAGRVPIFNWRPLSAATRYRVGVFSADGQAVWVREVDAPPVRWPDEVARTPGAYRWRVEALTGAVAVARSRLTEFEIPR